ncbi:MAG: zf-HC2 domain-containing protein [Anaerolineales bacterium]|nr:zf-HC2 domain-containing protein [Anaerolineales bacterium]
MSPLPHPQARAYLQLAADDRLGADEHAALTTHLAECAECRAYAADLERLTAALPEALAHGLETTPLPAGLAARVRARARGLPLRQRITDAVALALGAGAVLSLAAVFAWALGRQPPAFQPAEGGSGPAELTSTPPPWPTADFTQQPLHGLPPVVFAGAGSLQGFVLDQPAPGALVVTLLWLPAEAPADLQAFVHLEAAPGQVLAQSDAPFPGVPWGAGGYMVTEHTLRLPPEAPGLYHLYAGLYDPAAGARLSVEGAADARVDLGEVAWPLATATPFSPPGTPTPCLAGCLAATPTPFPLELLSATPLPTYTPCQIGCPDLSATPLPPSATPLPTWTPTPAAGFDPTLPPTPCQAGCPDWSPTPPPWPTFTATPLSPPEASATPACDGDCQGTWTPAPYTPEASYTPCTIGCPDLSATPLPTATPWP